MGHSLSTSNDMHTHHSPRPHFCREPGCSRMQGFKRASDRRRHESALHDRQDGRQVVYCCQARGCDPGKRWKRRDHFLTHARRWHQGYALKELVQRSTVTPCHASEKEASVCEARLHRASASTSHLPNTHDAAENSKTATSQQEVELIDLLLQQDSPPAAHADGVIGDYCTDDDQLADSGIGLPQIAVPCRTVRLSQHHEVQTAFRPISASPQPQHIVQRPVAAFLERFGCHAAEPRLVATAARKPVRSQSIALCDAGSEKRRCIWLKGADDRRPKSAPAPQDGDNGYQQYSSGPGRSLHNFGHGGSNQNGFNMRADGNGPQRNPNSIQVQTSDSRACPPSPRQGKIFPCVCHLWRLYSLQTRLEAPDPTPWCKTMVSYVSQLDIHHSGAHHNHFRCCTNCFRTVAQGESHRQGGPRGRYTCVFVCVSENCLNYRQDPPYANHCYHGTTNAPAYIWKALFRRFHQLRRGVWVPDPTLSQQVPPPNLPSNHPMATLYHPEWPPLHLQHTVQPFQSAPPQPPAPQMPMQHESPFPSHMPGAYASRDFTGTPAPMGQDILGDMCLPNLAQGLNHRQVQSLRNIAEGFWPAINSPMPSWQLVSPLAFDMYMSFNWNNLLNSDDARELANLLSQYVDILSNPASRNIAVWRDVRRWTMSLLDEEVQERCPWLQLRDDLPPYSSAMAAGSARQAQQPIYQPQPRAPTRNDIGNNVYTRYASQQIPNLADLRQYDSGRNPGSNPRAVVGTYGSNTQSRFLAPHQQQRSGYQQQPRSHRTLSRSSAASEGPQYSNNGSGSFSFQNVSSPYGSSQQYIVSGAASPANGFGSAGVPSFSEEAMEEYSDDENVDVDGDGDEDGADV